MNERRLPWWLWASVALCAALSLTSLSYRHRVESRNKAVTLAAEMDTIQPLAATQGVPLTQALHMLKREGLGAVVLNEESVAQLMGEGRLIFFYGRLSPSRPGSLSLLDLRIQDGLKLRFPEAKDRNELLPESVVRGASLGIDPDEAMAAKQAELQIVARFANVTGATDDYVRGMLAWGKEAGASYYLPLGDQVLGRRDSIDATVDALKALKMAYLSPEFAKLGGDADIVGNAPEIVVRLHSAQQMELDKLSVADAVERYGKAARERNMRMLLVRPVSMAGNKPVEQFGEFLKLIRKDIEKQGGAIAPAKPFEEPGVPKPLFGLIFLSAMPAIYWTGCALFSRQWIRIAGLASLVALAGAVFLGVGLSIAAFVAAVAFPTAAMLTLNFRRLSNPVVEFLIATIISTTGGLAAAGMLNALPYFVRAEAFSGVKVAVFLPVAIAGAYYFAKFFNPASILKSFITWRAAALGIGLLAVVAFMLMRTGNEALTGVSGIELQARNLLDQILFVRPRTKEFLIGHPALILMIALLAWTRGKGSVGAEGIATPGHVGGWIALAALVGAIGQTSVVNTLCHLHTPILLGMARIGVGVVLGAAIGACAAALIAPILRRSYPEST